MASLRYRILQHGGISCKPWKYWRRELPLLCISGRCLFRNSGIDFWILERELKEEGWICENEDLLDAISTEDRLKMGKDIYKICNRYGEDDTNFGTIPADWEEEDFRANGF